MAESQPSYFLPRFGTPSEPGDCTANLLSARTLQAHTLHTDDIGIRLHHVNVACQSSMVQGDLDRCEFLTTEAARLVEELRARRCAYEPEIGRAPERLVDGLGISDRYYLRNAQV